MSNELYASWHKQEFRPPKGFELEKLPELLQTCFGLTLYDFENTSSTEERKKRAYANSCVEDRKRYDENSKPQFIETVTHNKLIDIEYTNTSKYGQTLNRLTIQGKGFEQLSLDTGKIITYLEREKFVCVECHSQILIPPALVTFENLEKYFKNKSYTSTANHVTPTYNPTKDHATTWNVGARPPKKSANSAYGKRVTFYEAYKVHPEMESGTTRMELQLFGDAANKFMFDDSLRQLDLTVKTIGVIREHITFKSLSVKDSNDSRRAMPRFWKYIVDSYECIRIPRLDKPQPQIENKLKRFQSMLFSKKQEFGEALFLAQLKKFIEGFDLSRSVAKMFPFESEMNAAGW